MKTFEEWLAERDSDMLTEKRKKSYTTSSTEEKPMVIKGKIGRTGHVPHPTGTGKWKQRKPGATGVRRQQTRKKTWTGDD